MTFDRREEPMRKHRSFVLGASLLVVALFAAACSSGGDDNDAGGSSTSSAPPDKGEITVGVSGAFAENQLVAEMYAQVLEHAGYTVHRELDIADREFGDKALASGDIDLKPEYTGFELGFWDPKATTNGSPDAVAEDLATAAQAKGLVTYGISPANSTNVFVTLPATADDNNLTNLSSVASVAGDLILGAPADCPDQPFCLPGLKDTYGIEFGEVKPLDPGGKKTEAALDSGAVDVAEFFSLDPVITDKGYFVLEDDKHLQANGNFVPLVREEVANDELGVLLDSVTTTLTDEEMRDMVGQVSNEQADIGDVAGEYLSSKGIM
jgi:osmoprotectant transport system substrate-binding protein